MIGKAMEAAINKQINAELYSSYLYLAMSAWLDGLQLPGFAHWMRVQAQEEMTHAMRFYAYLGGRGGQTALEAIQAPPGQWASPLACFEEVAAHEAKVTALINGLMDLALEARDHASVNMLQWFIAEQVEEEASAAEVIGKLKLVAQTHGGLFMLDKDMAARTFVMPPDLTI
ncbi:Ferroxidase [Desulfarculus baarsii DSM 2075]|uniref:Ferritin n=1 Tax=Desulfarculus baarsii (strain ATCC 33931 / DSM 2075 / LMG 7858 / VKM B-1802 / 2st14) TaxID=644282 RepID=E1QGK8_DESB2|nr:ferritin [Desulfarculus baarsii]ADK84701.1 Ferroxidase [Desulfarculus baarsii DSM 2075]